MLKVGLTGGIGSGKSFVARHFQKLGIPVYYADKEAKRLMNRDKVLKDAIRDLMGRNAYHTNGRLNRPFIASLIFKDSTLLQSINALVHPAVKDDFTQWAKRQKSAYVLEESAIIFENGLDAFFDKVVLVTAPLEIRIKRVLNRDKSTRKQVMSRINQQLPDKKKIALANFVITNDGSTDLDDQITTIHKELKKISKSK